MLPKMNEQQMGSNPLKTNENDPEQAILNTPYSLELGVRKAAVQSSDPAAAPEPRKRGGQKGSKKTRVFGKPVDGTLYKYDLTRAEYNRMFGKGYCPLCGRKFSKKLQPVIDHCHHSGTTRSLLCNRCNTVLNEDIDPAWLFRAAAYLEKHDPQNDYEYGSEPFPGSPYTYRGYAAKHTSCTSGDYLTVMRKGRVIAEIAINVLPSKNAHASISIKRFQPRELREVYVCDDFDGRDEE